MAPPKHLTFFTELAKEPLNKLFATHGVIDQLVTLKAGVSMGILDFSDERALVVRQLNEKGIPLIAWQLLPKEEGYWYHLNSATYAAERYQQFHAWSVKEGLHWDAIGIDIEPDINEFQELLKYNFRTLFSLIKRTWNRKLFAESCATYESLVAQMRADGYAVQSYEYFFMADERKTGSSLLSRLFGIADVSTDKHVAMLYSSFFRPFGVGVLEVYARTADSAAIGITGGGVELEGLENKKPMTWDELSRDLRIANNCHGDVHVFSLEGCVEKGFLRRLTTFDWSKEAECPRHWTLLVSVMRFLVQGVLWLLANPIILAVAAATLLWMIIY